MVDKDRMGDKLRDKEKAEEDRYFAEQDRKKLDSLKENDAGPAPKGMCPKGCGATLAEHERGGAMIDICSSCGGIWFDRGELEQVMEREGEGWMTSWVRNILNG